MDHTGIRRAVRLAVSIAWSGTVVAAVVCTCVGVDATLTRVIGVGVLLGIITGTWVLTEVVVSVGNTIVAHVPAAEAIAAQTLLRAHLAAREDAEDSAGIQRIRDYRGR